MSSQHPNNKLTNLSVYGNDLGDEGAKAIAEAIKVNGVCCE
jgi:hypothetical protein